MARGQAQWTKQFHGGGVRCVLLRSRRRKGRKEGEPRVGLAVRESIVAGMDKGYVAVECISARMMKVSIQLKRKSDGVSFIIGYTPTLGKSTSEKYCFWNSLDEVTR